MGVHVTLKNAGTGFTRKVTTNEEGRWIAPALPVGAYEILYELDGFAPLKRSNVEVEAAVPRSLDDKLQVSATQTDVTVVADAAQLVTRETAAVAGHYRQSSW